MNYQNKVNEDHNRALKWFLENAGKTIPWTGALEDGTLLFTKAKGIYKPKNSEYALSIRHAPKAQYKDDEPVFHSDGTWLYNYHQEEDPTNHPQNLYTNKALFACMRDAVPIGVAIKISEKPNIRYRVLGLATINEYKNKKFKLVSYSSKEDIAFDLKFSSLQTEFDALEIPEFIPNSSSDARTKVLQQIIQRQGQKKFRNSLLQIYDGKCVITGCQVQSILEAAHITPYLGKNTNNLSNGLLLRADIHTLWDLGLIAIDPINMTIKIHSSLKKSEYAYLENKKLQINPMKEKMISKSALKQQLDLLNLGKN